MIAASCAYREMAVERNVGSWVRGARSRGSPGLVGARWLGFVGGGFGLGVRSLLCS